MAKKRKKLDGDPRTQKEIDDDVAALAAFEAGTFLAVSDEAIDAAVRHLKARRAEARKKNTLTVDQRWEQGIANDPRSRPLAKRLAEIDTKYGDCCMDLRFGGDGDNGEHLIYLLDIYFEQGGTL